MAGSFGCTVVLDAVEPAKSLGRAARFASKIANLTQRSIAEIAHNIARAPGNAADSFAAVGTSKTGMRVWMDTAMNIDPHAPEPPRKTLRLVFLRVEISSGSVLTSLSPLMVH